MEFNAYDHPIIDEQYSKVEHGSYSTLSPMNDPVYEPLDDYQCLETSYSPLPPPLEISDVISTTNTTSIPCPPAQRQYDSINETPGYDDIIDTPTVPGYDDINETPGYDDINETSTAPYYDAINEISTVPGYDDINDTPTVPGYDDINDTPAYDDINDTLGYDDINDTIGYDDINDTLGYDDINETPTVQGYDTINKIPPDNACAINKKLIQTSDDDYEMMSEKCQLQGQNYDYISNAVVATTADDEKSRYIDILY